MAKIHHCVNCVETKLITENFIKKTALVLIKGEVKFHSENAVNLLRAF